MKPTLKTILWLFLFSIAMGYMESAVVIYLRKIFYPGGFKFPLVPLDVQTGMVELLREAATITMLAGIAIVAGSKNSLRFAYFIFCFAIWDLCYYFFLWLFLSWPESLFTWDILFLIPVPWVGPVLAPCIVSITMLTLASGIIYFHRKGLDTKFKRVEWILLLLGTCLVFLSFISDYIVYLNGYNEAIANTISREQNNFDVLNNYIPVFFNWKMFSLGEGMMVWGMGRYLARGRNV